MAKSIDVLNIDGKKDHKLDLAEVFDTEIEPWLIRRAAIAENTYGLQPQGHFPLAGMQTTAQYYGAMMSYRTGRHMGRAIRPRERLGGGVQGKVKRIPSSVKGKRAHPHMIEKKLVEKMNKKEYQAAIKSAIAYSASSNLASGVETPIVFSDTLESVKKSKDIIKMLKAINIYKLISDKSKREKGTSRRTQRKAFSKKIAIIVLNDDGAVRASRNIPGITAVKLSALKVNDLVPGGEHPLVPIWSESALKSIDHEIAKLSLK